MITIQAGGCWGEIPPNRILMEEGNISARSFWHNIRYQNLSKNILCFNRSSFIPSVSSVWSLNFDLYNVNDIKKVLDQT